MNALAPERRNQGMAIGDVLSGKEFTKSRHSGQPVWRNSYYKGQFEPRLWNRPIADGTLRGAKRHIGAVLRAAKEMERRSLRDRRKLQPGCKNGKLGHVGLEVLEILYQQFVDYKTSRLDPAITTIAERIGRSYSAVHEALNRLRRHGFLHWIRRSEKTNNSEGPQVIQITNAYTLDLPPEVRRVVECDQRRKMVPDCETDRRNAHRADFEAMLSKLSAADWIEATWDGDAAMGESWRRIAHLMDERESAKAIETRPDILLT